MKNRPGLPLALSLLALGCRLHTTSAGSLPGPPPAPLGGVEFAECSSVDVGSSTDGPLCNLRRNRLLRVIVPPGVRDVHWTGAVVVGAASSEIVSTQIRVLDGATEVTLDATVNGAAARFVLRVAPVKIPPFIPELSSLEGAGKMDEAAALLTAFRAKAEAAGDRTSAAAAASALGELELGRGNFDTAVRLLGESSRAHAELGELSRAGADATILAHTLEEAGRLVDAAAAISLARARTANSYAERALLVESEGELARLTGDLRAAIRELGEAEAMARKMGLFELAAAAANDRALAFSRAGLFDDAVHEYEAIRTDDSLDAFTRAEANLNLGWVQLLKNDARAPGQALDDPEPPLRKALSSFSARGECPSKGPELNARSNLAWALLQKGDRIGARRELHAARASATVAPSEVAAFWVFLEAEILQASSDPGGAERLYARVEAEAAHEGASGDAFRAVYGRARALFRMNRGAEAQRALTAADATVSEGRMALAVDEGRASFVRTRAQTTRLEAEILLAQGAPAAALAAVRRGHARSFADIARDEKIAVADGPAREHLYAALSAYRAARSALLADEAADKGRSLEGGRFARDARRAKEDEVRSRLEDLARLAPARGSIGFARPPSGSGVKLVVLAPLEGTWAVFVDDGDAVKAERVVPKPNETSTALASELLGRISPLLTGATRIQLLVDDALASVDVHALAIAGQPLIARAPVEYVRSFGGGAPALQLMHALFVANPRGDLPNSEAEASNAARRMPDGVLVDVVEGRAATRERVLSDLESHDFLHYAGHGLFRGSEGWASELPLSTATLTVGDVLSLRTPPRTAVLSGCETAREDANGHSTGIGIATAFLAAGTEIVVGATRPVDDAAAAELMAAFYRAFSLDATHDPARCLAAAQREVMGHLPVEAWSAFRVLRR